MYVFIFSMNEFFKRERDENISNWIIFCIFRQNLLIEEREFSIKNLKCDSVLRPDLFPGFVWVKFKEQIKGANPVLFFQNSITLYYIVYTKKIVSAFSMYYVIKQQKKLF